MAVPLWTNTIFFYYFDIFTSATFATYNSRERIIAYGLDLR